MEFCPNCGARMAIKRTDEGVKLVCLKCGYETLRKVKTLQAKYENQTKLGKETLVVIPKENEDLSTLPTTDVECPRCGYGKAYWWIVQTRSADEAPTQFFRCKNCGYVWREYA